jgi:hypothetical protein
MGDLLATAPELKMRAAIIKTIAVVKELEIKVPERLGQSEHAGVTV